MRACHQCSRDLENDFRFCPYCGLVQRIKLVEHFPAHPGIGSGEGFLRVSAYLTAPPHVRFSIWTHDRAEAALSLEPEQVERLGLFLARFRPRPASLSATLRRGAAAVRARARPPYLPAR